MSIEGEDENELLLTSEDGEGTQGQASEHQDDEDEISIEIEGEEPDDETSAIRLLRERERRLTRENYDLRQKQGKPTPVTVGEKPTLEKCDWDEERFERDLTAWHEAKRQSEQHETSQQAEQREQTQEFERLRARHQAKAAALRIPNFQAHEDALAAVLGPELTGAALVMANDSAKLVAAVGSRPALLEKLQMEKNPLRKLAMLKDWEHKMVVKRKNVPDPEAATILKSTAPVSRAGVDKKAEALLAKAQQTGNMNEYSRYMRDSRQAKRA